MPTTSSHAVVTQPSCANPFHSSRTPPKKVPTHLLSLYLSHAPPLLNCTQSLPQRFAAAPSLALSLTYSLSINIFFCCSHPCCFSLTICSYRKAISLHPFRVLFSQLCSVVGSVRLVCSFQTERCCFTACCFLPIMGRRK